MLEAHFDCRRLNDCMLAPGVLLAAVRLYPQELSLPVVTVTSLEWSSLSSCSKTDGGTWRCHICAQTVRHQLFCTSLQGRSLARQHLKVVYPTRLQDLVKFHHMPAVEQLSVTVCTSAAGQVSSKAPAGPLDNGLPHEAAGALRIHTTAEASAATPLVPAAADATTAASGRGKLVQGKQSKDPEVKVRALVCCLRAVAGQRLAGQGRQCSPAGYSDLQASSDACQAGRCC